MKKLFNYYNRLIVFLVIILVGIYLYWLITVPMEFSNEDEIFGNFTFGLIILSIYILLTIGVIALYKFQTLRLWVSLSLLFPLAVNIAYLTTFYPGKLEVAEIRTDKYYAFESYDWDIHSLFSFYKCKKWSFECHRLYGSYGITAPKLVVDKAKNEVNLINSFQLLALVADGENPEYFTGFPERMGDKLYTLSYDSIEAIGCDGYSCRKFIYTLYTCNMDFTDCHPLPLQYTETQDIDPYWVADENNREISLYDEEDNGDIIFTYGEHPRCYVDGCKILQQNSITP